MDEVESQLNNIKARKIHNYTFNNKSNKLHFEFLQELSSSICEAKELVEVGSKCRLNESLNDMNEKIRKRQKMIRLADRSSAGWATVNEYLPDELASDSDDDRKLRQAENRAMSKKSKRSFTSNKPSIPTYRRPSVMPSASSQGQSISAPVMSSFMQPGSVPPPPPNVQPQQPFLGQGAFVVGGTPFQQQKQQIPFHVPPNVCFVCHEPGHWKHNCPNRTRN